MLFEMLIAKSLTSFDFFKTEKLFYFVGTSNADLGAAQILSSQLFSSFPEYAHINQLIPTCYRLMLVSLCFLLAVSSTLHSTWP